MNELDTLIALSEDRRFGRSREMIVDALWRFRKDPRIPRVLTDLAEDADVSLHAMSALRRAVGNDDALPLLEGIATTHPDAKVRKQATTAAQRARKALGA